MYILVVEYHPVCEEDQIAIFSGEKDALQLKLEDYKDDESIEIIDSKIVDISEFTHGCNRIM